MMVCDFNSDHDPNGGGVHSLKIKILVGRQWSKKTF